MINQTITLEEAAERTGFKRDTLRKYVHDGKIGAFKPGGKKGKLFFDIEELERWIRENRIKSQQELETEATTFYKRKAS